MSNITALKSQLVSAVANIEDALVKAEATVALDRYIGALTSQLSVESGAMQSYTIAGRTVTARNIGEGQAIVEKLRAELYGYLRGPISYMGMGGYA